MTSAVTEKGTCATRPIAPKSWATSSANVPSPKSVPMQFRPCRMSGREHARSATARSLVFCGTRRPLVLLLRARRPALSLRHVRPRLRTWPSRRIRGAGSSASAGCRRACAAGDQTAGYRDIQSGRAEVVVHRDRSLRRHSRLAPIRHRWCRRPRVPAQLAGAPRISPSVQECFDQ